ncbi:MAG: hypothetical protein ACI4UK_05055 [Floccifex sp.]
MKKIMIIGLIILSVFLIYLCNLDKKVYYLSLNGQDTIENIDDYSKYIKNYLKEKEVLETYVNEYSEENMKTTTLLNNINDNKKIKKDGKEITLKNALIKADLVTLAFSEKDIISRLNNDNIYDYIDDLSNDLDKLLKLMREYCKEDIILVGFYNPDIDNPNSTKVFKYLNKKYKEVCDEYKVDYIDLQPIFAGHPDFTDGNLPTQMGQNMIASEIINQIDKKMLRG